MKYSEAEKQIKALSSKYSTDMIGEYFNVNYKGAEVAYVSTKKPYFTRVWFEDRFKQMPFSNKIYMILSELAVTPIDKRREEKKYYVKICGGSLGYLNIKTSTNKMIVDSKDDACGIKTKFTDKAIKQLKKRDDVPLDWDKVKLEEVN
jgi:hypothetical protein|nr:MAG TPA: hypothetical protein [Caudoviricetes sp.]